MLEEVTEKAGFWILGVGGTIMVLLGWIMSKKMELTRLPLWQMLIIILVIWIASVFFAARD